MMERLLPLAGAMLLIATIAQADGQSVAPPSIGTATMAADGTITLDLHGDKNTNYATGQFVYKPSDQDYQPILDHLGGMKPGEKKPVPPWPEDTR